MLTEPATRDRHAVWSRPAQPTALFGGVYGLLVSSSAVAALTRFGETTRAARMDDALWVPFTAPASALASGLGTTSSCQGVFRKSRAVPAVSGACPRRAGRRPSYWTYLGLWPVRRGCVPGTVGAVRDFRNTP